MLTFMALISGEAVITSVIYLIVLGVVFGLLFWLIGYCQLPPPFDRVARVVLAIAAVIVLISVLMALAGHPIFK